VRGRRRLLLTGVVTVIALVGVACTAQRPDTPPGSPGVDTGYAPADKQGFGTARSEQSPVWFTLGHGGTTELTRKSSRVRSGLCTRRSVSGAGFVRVS
jgi:hypothetical protein